MRGVGGVDQYGEDVEKEWLRCFAGVVVERVRRVSFLFIGVMRCGGGFSSEGFVKKWKLFLPDK